MKITKRKLLNYFCYGVFGATASSAGLGLDSGYYWLMILTVMVIDATGGYQ